MEPPDFWDRIRSQGYRSMLAVHVAALNQGIGLTFWSKRSHAFDEGQLATARRIADHVALAVSHEQLAEMSRQATEAKLRADHLEARVKSLSEELAAKRGRMVGPSPEWQLVLKAATQVASTDTTVLLVGESGTGKEVVARFIHHASNRANGPFVALSLQVFDIKLPPLRERPGDILPLSEAFLQEIGQLFGRPPAGLTREAKDALLRYYWPGNVRQLRNALERAAILCEGGLITADHLPLSEEGAGQAPFAIAQPTSDLNTVERDMIKQALAECIGNKSKAAARLGISRTQL